MRAAERGGQKGRTLGYNRALTTTNTSTRRPKTPGGRVGALQYGMNVNVSVIGTARAHQGTASSRGESGLCRRSAASARPCTTSGHSRASPPRGGEAQPRARTVARAAPYGASASPPHRLGGSAAAGHHLRTAPVLKRERERDAEARKPDEGGSNRWDRVAGWRAREPRAEYRAPEPQRAEGRAGGKPGGTRASPRAPRWRQQSRGAQGGGCDGG